MSAQKVTKPFIKRGVYLLALLATSQQAAAQRLEAVSEKDFLTEMPIVLSVSRLPQRLDETPGAVTILDRDTIRLSGARDVADLLRLVPGFQSGTSFENGAPMANYHGWLDSYSIRMQVLVDGRSVYSPFLLGGTAMGLQAVALADIERIEVLRGSNSAAYGARAFLGVINIVTRHTLDTLGVGAALTSGENGIHDAWASVGWSAKDAGFRLTTDRRADDGLSGSNGHNQITRVNFRADLSPNAADEIQLRAGGTTIEAGKGFVGNVGDAPRDRSYASSYAQLDWRRSLAADEDLAFSLSHTQENHEDKFPYKPIPGLFVDFGGRAQSDTVMLQHTARHSSAVRVVLGAELSREQVTSKALYNTEAALVNDFTRLFGNMEWRFAKDLILNAGAMAERSSKSGSNLAPRVMLNWHAGDGQTLRFGVSKAYRPPSAFEQFGDVRYSLNGVALQAVTVARGNIRPESVLAHEIGYLGEMPAWGASLDVRAFHEQINGFVRRRAYAFPRGATLFPSNPFDYFNDENFAIRGLEYQLKWQPWRDAKLVFSQTFIDIDSIDSATEIAAPKRASALTFFQKLPGGLDLSLMYHDAGKVTSLGRSDAPVAAMTRTDLRLGAPLRFGRNRGELALVVQNLGAPLQDFIPEFKFRRRAFVTLRVEN